MLREIGAKKAEERDPKVVAKIDEAMPSLMGYLNLILEQNPHILGPAFTLADLQVACVLDYASPRSNYDLKPWPKVAAWHEACHARPAYQRLQALRAAVAQI
jgi:glutathione S-transferase